MSNIIIPTVEKDKAAIRQYLQTASDSLTRISAERDTIKEIIEEVSENASKRGSGQTNNDGKCQQDKDDDDGAWHVTTSSFVLVTS